MFSLRNLRNNKTAASARGSINSGVSSKHRMAFWIGLLFLCCLLFVGAAPWTVTGSNNFTRNQEKPGSHRQLAAGLPSGGNEVAQPGDLLSPKGSTPWQNSSSAASLVQRTQSNDGIWQDIDKGSLVGDEWRTPEAASYRALRLNRDALAQVLARAPMEFTAAAKSSRIVIWLPMPDGTFARFRIEESPVLEADLAARFPEIKSYRGQGIDDGTATVRFDLSPLGFHALVLSNGQAVSILPPNRNDLDSYASFFDGGAAFECSVNEQNKINPGRTDGPDVAVGSTLRTYRIAVAATNEYCVLLGGNTAAGTVASINTFLNGINAIYERELSVHMNLVSAPTVIYAGDTLNCGGVACNGGNDPYTNGTANTMLNEVRPDLDTKVGTANYDLGHVLGTNSGGVAFLGVVCRNTTCNAQPGACKGGGVSGMTAPAGNAGSVGLWAHELGHQFGANHTFNGTTSNCGGGNREPTTAYEPGSGSTIMSYAGICGTDNVTLTKDLRFHSGSFAEMSSYITGGGGSGCAAPTATGNNIPTVSAGTPFTIPRNTPFSLTATGTDADAGDVLNLTFVWEQIDAGGALYFNPPYGDQGGDPASTTRPLFRVFPPTGRTRTFPSATYILNNANVPPGTIGGLQTAESLPSVSRTMNFRATVRDNRAGFGGVNDSSVAITVDGTAGPFLVTAPNTAVNWTGGVAQSVTWSNVNTVPLAANVKISLSTDGGNFFPITLAASTANDGTEMITPPNGIISNTARVKVEAVGNIFFDISDVNFSLAPGDGCPAVSDISPKVGRAGVGDQVTITGINFQTGGSGPVTEVKFSSNVNAVFVINNNTQITATVPAGAVGGPITLVKPGCANLQTTVYNVCPNPPATLQVDDGSVNGASSNGDGYYVNRLTPGAYPATLNRIQIQWDNAFQNIPAGTPINIVAGINAAGGANIDGTGFQTFASTVGATGLSTYNLPNPVKIIGPTGDFVVGFQISNIVAGQFPILTDTTNPDQSLSYRSSSGSSFTNVTDADYFIRAVVYTGNCNPPTAAPATISGRITTPDGSPLGGAVMRLSGAISRTTVSDSAGNYHFDNLNTDNFYTVTPGLANYSFSPASRSFSLTGNMTDAGFTGNPEATQSANAIDTVEYFVRQQYLDFLGREPDQGGLEYWSSQFDVCNGDATCIRNKRIDVSAAFFASLEFQQTGSYIYGLYAGSLGRTPGYGEFMPDRAQVVGGSGLDPAKTAFAAAFVQRSEFTNRYPQSMSREQFVDAVIQTMSNRSGVDHSSLRNQLLGDYDTGGRALVVRQASEASAFVAAEYNKAFVLMEYFGYLRRDIDPGGYAFWLDVLERGAGSRGMVCAFLTSTEYQHRFSTVVTHSNAECGP